MPEKMLDSRLISKKFLDILVNMAGAWKLNYNYEAVKDRPDYTSKFKSLYPYAPKYEGAIDGVDPKQFVPTVSPVWAVDELKDKYAIFYVQADVDTIVATSNLSSLANVSCTIQKIVSNTATAITVADNITVGVTSIIVVDSPWLGLNQLQDYSYSDTANQLTSNDNESGGYVVNIDGLRTSDVTGITGNYYIGLATHFQMIQCKSSGALFYIRLGASTNLHELVYFLKVSATEFEPQGSVEGDSVATYSGTFSYKGDITKETIMTEGVIPTFI